MLLELATAKGIKAAGEARDSLGKSMKPEQIVEAKKRALDWKAKPEL